MNKVKRFLKHLQPVQFVVNRFKKTVPPGFRGIPLYEVLRTLIQSLQKAAVTDRAASITFFFLLAIPPTCIFLFTLLPYVSMDNLENTIYLFVRDITPNENTYNIVHGVIHDFLHTQRTGLLSFSFLLAMYYSSSAVAGIIRAFNRDLPGFTRRNFIKLRWMALKLNWVLIFLTVILVVVMVIQSVIVTDVLNGLHLRNDFVSVFIDLIRWILILLMFFMMLSLIYTYAPAREQRWKFITPGSTLATILMILTTLGFSFYVKNFSNYNRIYGSIGSIIILMLWVYINSYVLLLGFELNTSIELLHKKKLGLIEGKKDSKSE